MTSGRDDAPNPHEPTIADVVNGFGLYSGRSRKRRRRGRGRDEDGASASAPPPTATDGQWPAWPSGPGRPEPPVPEPTPFHGAPFDGAAVGGAPIDGAPVSGGPAGGGPVSSGPAGRADRPNGPLAHPLDEPFAPAPPSGVSAVRPYAWTRGRTRSGFDLAIETLVSASTRGRGQLALLQLEHRSVAELCEEPRSVAEIAALLKLPLGVVRVLLGDMAGLGVVTVHQNSSGSGNVPDLALMERVLSGLRRL